MLVLERVVQAIGEAGVSRRNVIKLVELSVDRMSDLGEQIKIEVQPAVRKPETPRGNSPPA
jgi:hypothetical protein